MTGDGVCRGEVAGVIRHKGEETDGGRVVTRGGQFSRWVWAMEEAAAGAMV